MCPIFSIKTHEICENDQKTHDLTMLKKVKTFPGSETKWKLSFLGPRPIIPPIITEICSVNFA